MHSIDGQDVVVARSDTGVICSIDAWGSFSLLLLCLLSFCGRHHCSNCWIDLHSGLRAQLI